MSNCEDAFYAVKFEEFNNFTKYIELRKLSINSIGNDNETFLMTHIRINPVNYKFVFYFLSKEINVNYQGYKKQTALMYLIYWKRFQYAIDMLQFYYNYDGASKYIKFNVNLQDSFGETALMQVAEDYSKNNDLVKEQLIITLFKYGATNSITNYQHRTASDLAKTSKFKQLIINRGMILK